MKRINKPNILPKNLLVDVCNSKKGANKVRMQSLKTDLEQRYDEYVEKADSGVLQDLIPMWDYDKNATHSDGYFLYHQYDNSKKSMSDLRAQIIEANHGEVVLNCPICELREGKDLDHYVPRQLFPEFSVHAYNLIPTCHECNNQKLSLWCQDNQRVFFNAYYDTPTDELLFNAVVKKENGLLRLVLNLKSFANPKEETRLALSTIQALDLMPYVNQRVNKKFNDKLKELIRRRKHFDKGDEDFFLMEKEILSDSIEDYSDVNNWDRIVYSVVKDEVIVEEWLKEQFSKK